MFDRQWILAAENGGAAAGLGAAAGQGTAAGQEATPDGLAEALMRLRGIAEEDRASFLHGGLELLPSPFAPTGMERAVDAILSAAEDGLPITVFGDYDADGITATAVLYHFLTHFLEADVGYYIPDRFTEGYGMSVGAVEKLAAAGTRLIVTVDNGVAAMDAAKRAEELGVMLIVTDHHQCPPLLPPCLVLLNPHAEDSGFPYPDLAGVGVAYTLVRALAEAVGAEQEAHRYLPIVALGTVGDCVPLQGENRILVRAGLKRLSREEWIGLSALLVKSGLTGAAVSATDVAFRIVPKLNAAGRLGNAGRALSLLLAEDPQSAEAAAELLIRENKKRQETEQQIYEEAVREGSLLTDENDACVIAMGKDWHHGVIGIVASRLTEKYAKPAIVLTGDGEDAEGYALVKGSARSVPGFHLYEALCVCTPYLQKFGGHAMAAGLTLRLCDVEALRDGLNAYAKQAYEKQYIPPHYTADRVLPAAAVTVQQARAIEQLEPFGEGNPKPVFVTGGLRVVRTARVGDTGKHLKVTFSAQTERGPVYLEGIAFGSGAMEETVRRLGVCSALYTLEARVWQGRESVSMQILDLHDFDVSLEKCTQCLYNERYVVGESFTLNRAFLRTIYKAIVGFGGHCTFNDLIGVRAELCRRGVPCSWYRLRSAVEVLTELGLLTRTTKTDFTLHPSDARLELSASRLYRAVASES